MPAHHFVGTSGFASPSARPADGSHAASDLLTSYAARFGAVEMDSSFARAPSETTIATWLGSAPDLNFVVRMPRRITHELLLADTGELARQAGVLSGLGDRLCCLLFTTPPQLGCDAALMGRALEALPDGTRTAWEFRHPSWLCPEVLEMLAAHGSGPVVVETLDGTSPQELLPEGEAWATWPLRFCYVRLRLDRYRAADIVAWSRSLGRALDEGRDVFAFFKQGPEAPAYATALGELLAERVSPGPARPATP